MSPCGMRARCRVGLLLAVAAATARADDLGRRIVRLHPGTGTEQHLQRTAADAQALALAGTLVASLAPEGGLVSFDPIIRWHAR